MFIISAEFIFEQDKLKMGLIFCLQFDHILFVQLDLITNIYKYP